MCPEVLNLANIKPKCFHPNARCRPPPWRRPERPPALRSTSSPRLVFYLKCLQVCTARPASAPRP
eukprot:5395571-Pleurochrysis_carterae.AAC.1